jgi:HSP20 family molecular chaperone IbpA
LVENSRSNRNKKKKPIFFGNKVDLERFLKEIQETVNKEIKEKFEKMQKKKAYPMFGYCVTLGPYGRIYIRELGHCGCLPHIKKSFRTAHELEPFVDILEYDKEVRVVAELPRISNEKINVIGTEKNLMIYMNRQGRKPLLNLDLPCSVNPEKAKATLKNGVLEVILKKGKSLHFGSKEITCSDW